MKQFDVVIVGAGPAGIAAAQTLKKNDINFCLIDNKKFPRKKLCAGGLTAKSIKFLKENELYNEQTIKCSTNNIELISNGKKYKFNMKKEISFADRTEFDFCNLKSLNEVNFFEEENIINISNNCIETNKQIIEYKYIIMADGVNGYSKKITNNRNLGFAVELDIDTKELSELIISFDVVEDGYGWVFPKKDYVTIGLGKFKNTKANYKELLIDFCKSNNIITDASDIKGFHIPNGKPIKKFVFNNNMIIVGDAAGLVDAITGEGIYYALESGKIAANSIICKLNDSKLALEKLYNKNIKKVKKKLKLRFRISRIFYSKGKNIFVKIGMKWVF